MKLTTGKQAVSITSEVLECFGGAGYVEDTGLPVLLRDSQVLPIWEGTTNVLALDTLRAIGDDGASLLQRTVNHLFESVSDPDLKEVSSVALASFEHAERWLTNARREPATLEAGARRFALTIGRALELALLIRQAQWSKDHEADQRPKAAARRFAQSAIDLIAELSLDDARTLIAKS
jgi:hypothetical protein